MHKVVPTQPDGVSSVIVKTATGTTTRDAGTATPAVDIENPITAATVIAEQLGQTVVSAEDPPGTGSADASDTSEETTVQMAQAAGTTESTSEGTGLSATGALAVDEPSPDQEIYIMEDDTVLEGITPDRTQVSAAATSASGNPANAFNATAVSGRVTTIDLGIESGSTVKIVGHPDYGNVTVNPDNSLALVLTGETGTDDLVFSIEITHKNGTVEQQEIAVDVTTGPLAGGWGTGDYYMLETDTDGKVVVEHGEKHRKVYVSGSDAALSAKDIAKLEGISVKDVTAKFLVSHSEYGATADKALDADLGTLLWGALTEGTSTSNWLLFERGYSYTPGRLVKTGTDGESELHPLYIGAYGTGTDPVIESNVAINKEPSDNIVIQGLTLASGLNALRGSNLLIDDVRLSGEKQSSVQNFDGFTFRNSEILDMVHDAPIDGSAKWSPSENRLSGIFIKNTDGILIENVLADHVGWADGYDPGMSAKKGQPPSKYSHNFYLQRDNLDVTFRDNISLRASGTGAQIRSGGFIEDNVFIDGNGSLLVQGGYGEGNYSLLLGNLITSAGYKMTDRGQGALSRGIMNESEMTSLMGNIVTHMADPNNAAEIKQKTVSHAALTHKGEVFYDDTIVFDWGKKLDVNATSLSENTLNNTTIQKYAAALTGKANATIADLATYLRAQADGKIDSEVDADAILDYFRDAFGIDMSGSAASSVRFVPNDVGDGVRWDNRLNWDSGATPTDGQDVTLADNLVWFSGTIAIDDLNLGSYGDLIVNNGKLSVNGILKTEGTEAIVEIDRAGQVWLDGYADGDLLNVTAAGGRLANTGDFEGAVRMDVSGNAQVILATGGANFDLRPGSQIVIHGDDVRVGFDGTGNKTAVLRLDADSSLAFDAGDDGKMGTISEFASGAYGDAPAVKSGVNLGSADLHLDVTGMAAGTYVLVSVDELIGTFGGLDVVGLGKRDATVVVDYTNDQVLLKIAGSGKGTVDMQTTGDESGFAKSDKALWTALNNGHGNYAEATHAHVDFAWDWMV